MMVIWVLGVFAFSCKKPKISFSTSWLLSLSFLACSILGMLFIPSYPYKMDTPPFFWASQFFTDYLIGILFGISIWLLPLMDSHIQPLKDSNGDFKYFRKIANMTFPIYVLHFPILVLIKSIFYQFNMVWWTPFICCLFTLILCISIGLVLEHYRLWWVNFFKILINKIPS
jgi:peptidoglycan/LPS O-acetylase OafA/YrhL